VGSRSFPENKLEYIDSSITVLKTDLLSVKLIVHSVQHSGRWVGGNTGHVEGGGISYIGPEFHMDVNGDFWRTVNDYGDHNILSRFIDKLQFHGSHTVFRRPLISRREWERTSDVLDQHILAQLR